MSLPQSQWYTEKGWLQAENPYLLVEILRRQKVRSSRKYRLAACACCRLARGGLKGRSRTLIEQSEKYADGLIGWEELRAAVNRAGSIETLAWGSQAAALQTGQRQGRTALHEVLEDLLVVFWSFPEAAGASPKQETARRFCHIIRDVFGNPFRPMSLKSFRTPDVLTVAQGIYEEKDWSRMGVLGDALQDAGCQDAVVLEHCRDGDHVRGCWVVDLVLARR